MLKVSHFTKIIKHTTRAHKADVLGFQCIILEAKTTKSIVRKKATLKTHAKPTETPPIFLLPTSK